MWFIDFIQRIAASSPWVWLCGLGSVALFIVFCLGIAPAKKEPQFSTPPVIMNLNTNAPINITGNTGNTQVSINSPGSKQVINQKRVLSHEVKCQKGKHGDLFMLKLTINQTEGIWDAGQKFSLQIYFTGPYLKCEFRGAYDSTKGVYSDAVESISVPESYKQGYFELTTSTPPKNEPFVLEITSLTDITVKEIRASPADGYGPPI